MRLEFEKIDNYYWGFLYVNDKLVASDLYTSIWEMLSDPEWKTIIEDEAKKLWSCGQ